MNKSTSLIFVGIAVLILAAAVGFWGYNMSRETVPTETATQQQGQSPTATAPAGPATNPAPGKLIWSFTEVDSGEDTMNGPRTAVMLTAEGSGKKYDLGVHTGSCAVIESSGGWQLLAGEKTGVICWWAGGGTELGVFEENGKMAVKIGDIEEGTAESDGFRGNFKTLVSLD